MSTVKDVSEFYGKLQGSNAFIGLPEEKEFVQMFDNTQARRGLYEQLRNSGRINGLPDTFEEFSLAFGYNASGDSRLEQKQHNREVAEDNLRAMREDGLIEEAKEIKKDAAKSKRQARRRTIAEYITSPKMTGTATGVAQPIGQQIAEQNVENALQNEEYRESAELYGEERLLHRTMRDALRDAKNVERGVFGQWTAPLAQKIFNVSTWDMGVSEGLDNLTLSALLEKADNGTITESEEMLLDTLALANVIQQNADAAKSGVTKVAEALPQSFAFMAQMAANPASGFTRSMAKRAVKKYGVDAMEMGAKELMRNYGGKALARKVGAGLAASVPEAAAFATTVGATRSIADAERRAQGGIQTYVDDNGFIQYAGHTEGEDLPTALLKSFGSTFIESWSEMLGTAAFDPMLSLLKGVKSGKMMSSLADLKKGLNAIKGSEWSVAIKNFKQNAHWDGIINEMLEEEVGMVMSGLFNIENTLNRYNEDGTINENWILDGGNLLRTLLTIALTEGHMKAVEYVGNIGELRKMENNLKIAESNGAKIVGARWGEIQKEIDGLDPDGVADYIMSLASDPAITNEMLEAATNYATTLVRWQQYNLATDTQEYNDMSEVMRNAMAAYRAGRQMHIANFRSVQQRADKAYDALAKRDADLLKRADGWLEQQKQTGKLPVAEIETIRNGLSPEMSTLLDEYIGAMTARQGIYDNIDDQAYSQMDVFERDLAPVIRDGAVTTATLDGKPVYVLSQENGSAVILSEDAETEHEGKGMMVDASRLKNISTIDAKQLVDAYRYRYATDEQTKADMALNHHPNTQMPTVGMQIDTPSATEGGATTFIVTNVQPQMGYVEMVPGEYDAEQGKVVPKDGAEPIYQTVYSTLQMQDEMYDTLDAMNGSQSVQVENGIIEDNEQTEEEAPVVVPTEEEVVPTEEEVAPVEEEVATQEEEVATEETAPVERSQAEIDADDAAELAEFGDNDYISSNLDKAKKVLDKAKKKKPKATEKEARLAEARAIKAEVDAAQAEVDRWTAASQEVARRALQATQTEQAPTGEATGVGEDIQGNWAEAEKIEGNAGSKTLQDGTVIKGRYMLVPASAPTASHDALNGYAPSVGFPTNERGQNINDRDYQNDKAAQTETDRIARVYGGQAVSDTPVVSPEGIVYSGNGRTMASQLAAANGTDTAYMEALRSNAAQFGFTPEQVDSIPNARVVFVTDEVLPYTTETFAKFNQQEKKTQSSTERAVSKSKSLKDKSIARILSIIDSYDTLQSFFNSSKACADMLSVLQQDGVITEAEVAGLTELNSNNETILSATGRDLVTDVVLGATFSEQTLRQMGGDKALKQSVLRALPSIIENRQLKEYALNNELEKAISLLYEARKAKMSLEQFLQSTDMFEGSPTDRYSAFEVLLAEKFNNSTEAFRVMMQLYNNSASTLVGGQSELFGETLTKEDIQNLILEKYGKQTNNRGDQTESVAQSESGNRQDNETTAAERRAKYGITAKEDARREPLRERAREVAEKLGTNINVIEDKSEVTNEDAKKQMRQHKNSIVKGWFENSTGELFIVLPSMDDMADLEATILHELVAHKGLRNLLGARKFNQLCDAVWEMMTPEQQQEWLAYPGVNGNKRAAADEYIASLAEKMDLSEVEQTTWSKIKQFVFDVLQKLGFRDITENDIQDLIRASYAYMRAGNTNEQTTNEGNRYKVYRSRDGKEVGYTQLSQLSLQFDWGERERDTVSGRNTDVLQREDDATLTTLNTNRQLEEGEVCNVERIFTESKGFDFTSGEKIESAADVAYIFKNLEDEAIENVFVALVKDGKPTVIHVGMGGQAYSLVDNSAVVAAANRINPDKVYLVHNHPSGALRCSPQDRSMLKSIKDALGDVVQDGIIINTRSGKFGVFSESMFGTDSTSDMPENKEDSLLKVYKFNKQAFKSNVITVESSPYGIAEFISTQRLGTRNKINALLLNNQYGCVGNVFLTETEVNDTNRDSIAQRLVDDAVAMNAKNIVIYGNYPLVSVAVESNIQLREAIEKASGKTVELKDVIEINGSTFPPSALNYGVRFRTTIAPDVRKEMETIKADAIANGTFLKAPNGKDTNLNEEQWLMVRTNNFKKWFGDWMKASRIEKLRKSKAIDVDYNNEYELNRESAKAWMKDNLRGEYTNADTGEVVSVTKIGSNKVTSHGERDEAHLKSIIAIPSLIENSIFIEEQKNEKDNDRYDSYRYYVCGAKIDGGDYTVKVVIGVKGDSKYYDHRLTQIEKGTLIDNLNGMANPVAENQNANNSMGKDSKLISILQTNSSKIIDENGEPMVVYHGTGSEFTSFEMQDGSMGRGAYFTSNWDEAAQYAMEKQGVENIEELDESKIKEVFLDVRDEKNIAHSRFSRGDIEVLATSPNQIKSATDNNGEFGESNDIRFRIVNDLIAVHNLTEDKLRKVFDMGGLIMPSIAITKVDMGHEGYGEISLLFDKDTIDPSNRRNKVFGGDAWTPRIPQLMPKLNEKVSARVKSKIRELIDNRALTEMYSLSAELHQDNIERTISERGVKGYYSEEWMKYAYLLDNGKKVKIPMMAKDYGTHSEMILELLKEKGLKASEINKDAYDFYKNNPDVVEDIKNRINEKNASSVSEDQREAVLKFLNERGMSFNFFSSLIRSAAGLEYDLENGGKKQIIDRGALRETINKKVKTDNTDYNKWVDNLFEGIVEKYGIRNKTDWYTPSGNLRSWEKLYDAATPENILRYMLNQNEQGGSGGFWDSNIMGASADTYESIEEIREKGQKRLRRVDSNEYDEWATSVANRFSEISDEFLTPAQRNDFGGIIDAKIAITNAVAKDKTAKGIYKEMKADYPNFTMDHANRVVEIVREIQDYAIGYFEAKPQRIVPLSEVRKAIVPSNTSEDIVKELKDNGIEVATYRKGNEASRQRLIKKESNGIRFRVANENQEIFVSNAQRAVEGINQDKATPEQWLAMITKQGGLKAGEDKWLGLSDWLKSSDAKTITKQEILDFIAENKIQIEEVKYGEGVISDDDAVELRHEIRNRAYDIMAESKERYYNADNEEDSMMEAQWNAEQELEEEYGKEAMRFFTYQISGDNFEVAESGRDLDFYEFAARYYFENSNANFPINSTRLNYTTKGLDNKQEIALTVPTIETWNQSDEVHFGDAGDGRAIAWVRFGETRSVVNETGLVEEYLSEMRSKYNAAEGEETDYMSQDEIKHLQSLTSSEIEAKDNAPRVLVIDEIQSKRHQEGREKGYKSNDVIAEEERLNDAVVNAQEAYDSYTRRMGDKYNGAYEDIYGTMTEAEQREADRLEQEVYAASERYNNHQVSDIPDAPFDKNWHELAMKRMLRLAAEEGYDYVAWTTGTQQAKRYNIGSAIDYVDASPSDIGVDVELVTNGGGYITLAVEENGTIRTGGYANENFAGKQLSEVVGKELAVRILSTTEDNTRYEGEDLVIGGEGMKGFYDKMLPSFVSKYTKKWGAKVEDIELPELEESARVMHSVNITPEMKESVMQGQTMFRTTYHGSSAKFDKFDHSFMGTGEGAQAFGWGTYVTEVEGIGRKYGNVALNGRNKFKYVGDKDVNKWTLMDAEQIVDRVGGYEEAVKIYGNKPLAPATALDNAVRFLKSTNKEDWEGQRHLYTVEIPDDNGSNYLHYTLTVGADKAERVGEGLEADGWTLEYSEGNLAKYTKDDKSIFVNRQAKGADLYQELVEAFGSEKDVSLFLNEIGFVGIAYPAEYYSGGRSDGALNYVIFNEDDLEITNHTIFRIKEVNDKFNSELETLNEENADKVVLNVGNPSPVLLSAGVEDRPMKLYGNKIIKKVKKHGLKIQDLKNLPSAVADPIAVFDNYKQEGNRSILTELRVADGNILATIDLGEGTDIDFNIVSSTFGKSDNKIVSWINKGLVTYINKEKALDYLHLSAPIAEASDKKELSSATNIVENFENPTIESENSEEVENRTMFSVKQRTEADYQDIESRLGIAAAEYERRMDMASVHHMEAWQDSMRSLLEMQRAIEKETGKPILDYENAYMAENRMSSENFAQMEEWKRKFFKPLYDIYKGFIDRGENKFSIRDYLFAKHGMERNAVMARREAQRLYPNDPLQQIAKESDLKRTKDYSGLKKLMGKNNIPDAIAEAQKYVQDFEKKHKAEIAKFWDAIRNATHSQLEVQRASGLLTQEKYEEIKNMYNYYVPLRGFSETTTDEVYDYLDNSPTPYNVPIKAAKGRESVGDDPIANIANMAESGIMQANRNKMKLHFLNMAEQHKTNLVTVSEVIYKYNPVAKMWEPTLPALSPNDTIEETLAKIRQHRANVAKEMILNPQDYKTEANLKTMGKDVPYKVINKAMLSEHQVLVMRDGKQMVMTINGNPRAAQALNGLTNPEVKAEEQRWIQKANRFMAANFTSRNPAFVISNLSRDSIYAVSMVWAKEAPKYARAFMNNMGKVFANMASLMHKYNNGTLDTNVPMEKMFLEFVMNGGQTGYTHLNSVEDYKRQMAKEMKRAAQHKGVRAVTETGRAILNGLESMNKWAENISRFTAYVTSREDGRSISRSISDAKEISVNFNKKGAGNSVAGKFEKGNRLNYLSSQAAQLARGLYVFMNAGIQGMANFAKQAKRHPKKVTAMIASSIALGLAAALLGGGGDDEEEYLSLPKYTRRNNLCIKVGDKFVTIPLPIELRAFYGIGELIASRTALGEYYSDAEFAKEFAEQLSQLLPIDVLEGGEGFNIKSFIPSAAKPIVDAILNESWTGIPIYNDSEFVKTYPGWKKAYKGTNDMLVDVSRWLNEMSGGSDYRQGWMNINPAAIEYIAEQYLGGVGTTVNQFFKMGQTATGVMEFEWRNVPVASRFVNSGNETTLIRAIRNSYYDYREEMDAVGKEFNAYMRDLKKPDLPEEEYQRIEQEIDRIVNSPEYDFYLWWKDINKVINRAKDAGDTEGADELMREAVETYRSWKKGLE